MNYVSVSREVFKKAKVCAHCARRFCNRGQKTRKRVLVGREEILCEINDFRVRVNKPPLNQQSIICLRCFDYFKYSSSVSTCSENVSEYDGDSSESDTSDNAVLPSTSSIAMPSTIDAESFTPEIIEPNIVDESTNVRLAVNRFAPLSLEKCALCSISLTADPTMWKVQLCNAELLLLVINGERSQIPEPMLRGDDFVCERCFVTRLRKMHSLWRKLPNAGLFKPLTEEPFEQPRPLSQMETSQPLDTFTRPSTFTYNENDSPSEMETENEDAQFFNQSDSSSDQSSDDENCNSESLASPARKKLATDDNITLPVRSLAVSGTYCFICGKRNVRVRPGHKVRIYIYCTMGLYVSKENRLCEDHRDKDAPSGLNPIAYISLAERQVYEEFTFSKNELSDFLSNVYRRITKYEKHFGRLSFRDHKHYTDNDFRVLFGLSREHFNFLHSICKPHMRTTVARSTEDAVAIFLMKLRINPSHRALACFFNTTFNVVSVSIMTVRKILYKYFAKDWLGFSHISRQTYINDKTSVTSKTITGASDNQAICVIDGTYLYFQKSANYNLQRRTYSLHKFRNLLKVMMVVSTRGYILAAEGPYFADHLNNDSNIMKNMMRDRDGFRSFFLPGDYIIEDRGFRDCNSLLTNLGFSVKMPHFLGKRKQHPTHEANESRLVTKIRWIVESVNGRIKNVFRFFRDIIPNEYMRKNRGYEMFQIACAILNAFHPLLFDDDESDRVLAEQMLIRSELPNLLQERLVDENFIRMTLQWQRVGEESLKDFPRMTLAQLRELTFGVYQIKEAPSYMADTQDEFGQYDIFFHNELQCGAVRFRVQSRHRTGTRYDLWVGYDDLGKGPKSVTGWFCKCPNGSRVVGCCAHIAAIVWYLSYSRYLSALVPPASTLADGIRDASTNRFENEYMDLDPAEEQEIANQVAVASGILVSDGPAVVDDLNIFDEDNLYD